MIRYVKGNAAFPFDDGIPTVIAHVCNNAQKWGAGFTKSIDSAFPEVGQRFLQEKRSLNDVHCVRLGDDLLYANMVCMNGVRSNINPEPLDMESLRICLRKVSDWADRNDFAIQMPMIGSGLANGSWAEIQRVIDEEISSLVTVVVLDA